MAGGIMNSAGGQVNSMGEDGVNECQLSYSGRPLPILGLSEESTGFKPLSIYKMGDDEETLAGVEIGLGDFSPYKSADETTT